MWYNIKRVSDLTNKQAVKKSAEAKYYLHDFKLVTIGYIFLMLFSAVVIIAILNNHLEYMRTILGVYLIGITCLYLPFAACFAWKYFSLFSSIQEYTFYEKFIEDVHFEGNSAYFSITIADPKGNALNINTKSIYHSNYKNPHYEDFYQKKAIVAYNSVTNQVLLIDLRNYSN